MPLPWWRGCGFARSSGTPWGGCSGTPSCSPPAPQERHPPGWTQFPPETGQSAERQGSKFTKDTYRDTQYASIFSSIKLLNIILTEFYCACTVTRYFIKSTSPLYLFSNPLPHISTSPITGNQGEAFIQGRRSHTACRFRVYSRYNNKGM